ncbi:Uncharacterised protein [uncultured archaeon]|nr:Uncharacterised protein [uncultured archaeon]
MSNIMSKSININSIIKYNKKIINGSLSRAGPIYPCSAKGFPNIFCRVIAASNVAAPAMYLLSGARNNLLLAPELEPAPFRKAELL